MLGELEVVRLIEENDYPARVIEIGVVWIELEITDAKTSATRRERLSKSAFADLILDWRDRRTRTCASSLQPFARSGSPPKLAGWESHPA